MKPSLTEPEQKLKEKNINLSFQRLKVLEYLVGHRCHPSVEKIFSDLHKEISTLSKTTVYNTLRVLTDAGLVRAILTEDETKYDINTQNHGHFQCKSCGEIYDFDVDTDKLCSEELKDFRTEEKAVYFKGICPNCISGSASDKAMNDKSKK